MGRADDTKACRFTARRLGKHGTMRAHLYQFISIELEAPYWYVKGDVAQMVERALSMREVRGSMPRISTFFHGSKRKGRRDRAIATEAKFQLLAGGCCQHSAQTFPSARCRSFCVCVDATAAPAALSGDCSATHVARRNSPNTRKYWEISQDFLELRAILGLFKKFGFQRSALLGRSSKEIPTRFG